MTKIAKRRRTGADREINDVVHVQSREIRKKIVIITMTNVVTENEADQAIEGELKLKHLVFLLSARNLELE